MEVVRMLVVQLELQGSPAIAGVAGGLQLPPARRLAPSRRSTLV